MVSQKPREESVLRKRQQSATLKGAGRLRKRIESIGVDNVDVSGNTGLHSSKMMEMDALGVQRREFEVS